MRPTAVALALLCAAIAGSAGARHRGGGQPPGEFDYYVLSLSWSPAFCLDAPGAAECNGPRRYGFIVHGLWPQYESGSPQHCAGRHRVPEEAVRGIIDLLPARSLIEHEWSVHGTCSGLEPMDFFALVRRAYREAVVPQLTTQSVEQPTAAIADDFLRANPRMPAAALVVTCTGEGAPRLREVRLCLTRELVARECSPFVMRAACRARTVIVPPIR